MCNLISPKATISLKSFPFRYGFIENVFSTSFAKKLQQFHGTSIVKAKHIGDRNVVGERLYSAINYTPNQIDFANSAIAGLASDALKQFIVGLLGVQANNCIMLHLHRHHPPSKSGHPHTDCAVVSFPAHGPTVNGFKIYQPDSGCIYADDSRDSQPTSRKVARSLACIYYLGIQDWKDGDGGETSMFALDKTTVLEKIPPKHNSLLIFDSNPISYHAYSASESLIRDSIIWWYHDEVDAVMRRHRDKFFLKASLGMEPWDRWTSPSTPKYNPSPVKP